MNTPPRHGPSRGHGGRPLPRRLPLPVSVTLYNFCAPFSCKASKKGTDGSTASRTLRFRPVHEHSSSLLRAVRLELVATIAQDDKGESIDSDKDDKRKRNEQVLYTCVDTSKSVCPTFQHLNEYLFHSCSLQGVNNIPLDLETFESLTVRFSVSDDSNDTTATTTTTATTFLSLPIHPSKLVRIPAVPTNLPLNAVAVHFSDESIRVTPALYQLLKDGGVLDDIVNTRDANDAAAANDYAASRFDDNVFRTLDQVTPAAAVAKTTVSLLETDDESLATPVVKSLFGGDDDDDESAAAAIETVVVSTKVAATVVDETATTATDEANCWSQTEETSSVLDLDLERLLLERLIQEEEALLEQEMAVLQNSKSSLQTKTAELEMLQEQTQQVVEATQTEEAHVQRVDFSLQAQRIKLFCELRTIYRVTVNAELRYFIQGLEIPQQLYAGTVSEEEVGAALGHVAHLVTMMSKYLDVQLRYRIYCFSSRSAIQDDRGAAFPLFQGRTVERLQLEHGVRLLDRNVECICQHRGIRIPLNTHVLAKVKRVYEHVIDGY